MVGLGRLERPTSPLSGVRSNHLSYRPSHPAKPDQTLSSHMLTNSHADKKSITGRTGIREERETRTAISRQTGPD